uniref:Centriole, cilia and spindle associated protein n=1 Tax=Pseudonaja textilis TaxID=8673 RepID=A0A670Z4E7_PSETE
MVLPSRCVKSEYMKCFKEPKWEACGPCYQELLRYRLSRRLLEQAHRPWFWDDWEQDSSLNGSSGGGSGSSPSSQGTDSPPVVRLKQCSFAIFFPEADIQEQSEGKAIVKKDERTTAGEGIDSSSCAQKQPLRQKSVSGRQGDRKAAKSAQKTEATLGIKHPFALYGWGEKQTDTGSQKTHNVRASASVNEIHESALRAKNRRQIEKRKLPQRRIHTAEVERTWRTKPSGPDNPWMTEYMRCYSARAR